MISVLILTLNEEVNIADCLASVAWADDVLVVDSGSTDRTTDIARSRGARVMHRDFDSFAEQRNFGLQEGGLATDWILHLDADERVTPALRDELRRVTEQGRYDAFRVPSKLMLNGQWLKHAGMYPTYQIRFGRREALTFKQVGHGQRGDLPDDRIGTLNEPLIHHAFSKGLAHWFERHNRYSSDEAKHALRLRAQADTDWTDLFSGTPQDRRRALKDLSYRLPLRPLLRFLYVYVVRRGFLDGTAGFTYSVMLAMYEAMIDLKVRWRQNRDEGGLSSSES